MIDRNLMVTWRRKCLNLRMRVIAEYQFETVTVIVV